MGHFINILVSYAYNCEATCQELLPKENSETPLKRKPLLHILFKTHTLYSKVGDNTCHILKISRSCINKYVIYTKKGYSVPI
jgi:hypothetical protein